MFARGAEIDRLAREFATTLKNVRLIVCTDQGADVVRLEKSERRKCWTRCTVPMV